MRDDADFSPFSISRRASTTMTLCAQRQGCRVFMRAGQAIFSDTPLFEGGANSSRSPSTRARTGFFVAKRQRGPIFTIVALADTLQGRLFRPMTTWLQQRVTCQLFRLATSFCTTFGDFGQLLAIHHRDSYFEHKTGKNYRHSSFLAMRRDDATGRARPAHMDVSLPSAMHGVER